MNEYTPSELGLTDKDFQRLVFACKWHTSGQNTGDSTILACWDSDRLDIGRIGVDVDIAYLGTDTARQIAADHARFRS